jgi:hypothetical protein
LISTKHFSKTKEKKQEKMMQWKERKRYKGRKKEMQDDL